ncbi:MAG: hypothetical protein EAZ91_18620 [Cytophagales bacterium]|nr:MAG: hypothetical protein EAZ91_18620 [Cytophagales bacterium]
MTIQIEVSDDVVQRFGIGHIQKIVENRISAEDFWLLAQHIGQSMDEAATQGVNWDTEFEQARQEAWEEYKQRRGWQ